MYLSLLRLDSLNKYVMRTLSDAYSLHQYVMAGFKKYDPTSRVLFRVEPEVKENIVRVLIQSVVRPSWCDSGKQGGLIAIETKEFEPRFSSDVFYRFRLRVNPVVTRNGNRYGLIRDEALINWLKRKEQSIGATFSSVRAIDEGYVTGTRKKGEKTDRINIKTARFEGILRISDPKKFSETIATGIGPAKAFGCGLLSLARV